MIQMRAFMKKEHVLNQFPKYHVTILLWEFNAKEGKENVFKMTFENDSLHKNNNGNGVTVANFVKPKCLSRAYNILILQHL
jgi:hypothetical protein